MKRPFLFFIFFSVCFFLIVNFASAQTKKYNIDSLLQVSATLPNDSAKVMTLLDLSIAYKAAKPDSADYFADKALTISRTVNYKKGIRRALSIKSGIFIDNAKYELALQYLDTLKTESYAAADSNFISVYFNNAAICYNRMGDIPKALEKYLMAARFSEANKSYLQLAGNYNNISAIYRKQLKDYDNALLYAFKSVELANKINDDILNGNTYEKIGSVYFDMEKLDTALFYNQKSLAYYIRSKSKLHLISQYTNVGNIFLLMNKIDSAFVYLDSAVNIAKQTKYKSWHAKALFVYADALSKQGKNDNACKMVNDGIVLAKEAKEPDKIRDGYSSMLNILTQKNDYKNALLYRDSIQILDDSLNSLEKSKNLRSLQLKYETEKKENEIAKLGSDKKIQQLQLEKQKAVILGNLIAAKQKQNEIDLLNQQQQIQDLKLKQQSEALTLKSVEADAKDKALKISEQETQIKEAEIERQSASAKLIIAGAIALLAFVILGFNQYRINLLRKSEKEKYILQNQLSELKLEALRSQMNPHFIFNALNSINRYIIRSDKETASDYLVKFSKLIRLILENSKSTFIPLQNELEAVKLYVDMELLRFDNKFDFNISVDESINKEKIQIPPMVLQPYIENAIWHGLMNKKEMGAINISVKQREKDKLFFVIEDNGIGRQRAAEMKNKTTHTGKSFGMDITKERIAAQSGSDKNLKIVDLFDADKNPVGTRVEIILNCNNVAA